MGVIPLASIVQHYDWGCFDSLAKALGRTPSGRPEAELWMGTHERGPSPLAESRAEIRDLAALIASDPVRYLGERVAASYGQLPFLFKVLAAGRPLSLQAHPNQGQARLGFDAEQERGIPLDSSARNYRDRSHKPELLCALTRFSALAGFRAPTEAAELCRVFLAEVDGPVGELSREFTRTPDAAGLEAYFKALFSLSRGCLEKPILSAAGAVVSDDAPLAVRVYQPWLKRLAQLHPQDPGVLASMLLNLIVLEPREAIYLPAGNLHAYLEGVGLELMACSDNVLRGGLTNKHVDVAELFRVLVFSEAQPLIERGAEELKAGACWRRYITPAEEFELSLLELNSEEKLHCSPPGPEIWLGLEGEIQLMVDDATVLLSQGDQVFVSSGASLCVSGVGRAARAALPR